MPKVGINAATLFDIQNPYFLYLKISSPTLKPHKVYLDTLEFYT